MYEIVKRCIDIILSVLFLLIVSPTMVIIAILIKIESKGPVLYRSIRIGKNGRSFSIYKFRTMVIATDDRKHNEYVRNLLSGELGPEKGGVLFKIKNDPIITRIGKFLRRMNLDELPQFINVLIGDMSIVGTRAALPYEVDQYEDWQKERLSVKPGITGIWQISGRSSITFREMVMLDIYYIKQRSIWLDILIMLKTIPVMLFGRSAY